jgi:hypothetical protein
VAARWAATLRPHTDIERFNEGDLEEAPRKELLKRIFCAVFDEGWAERLRGMLHLGAAGVRKGDEPVGAEAGCRGELRGGATDKRVRGEALWATLKLIGDVPFIDDWSSYHQMMGEKRRKYLP